MAQRPPRDIDWISDDSTGITVPSTTKQNAGWLVEKPARQFFNWMWNRLSRWTHYFSGQSQEFIVIDSTNANEKDYDTLAAYIADSPAAGDKVLVKETQALAAQMIIPNFITLHILDGVYFTRSTNEAASVIKFGSDIIIEGILNLFLSHTGITAKAIEFDGDNVVGKINVENSSTGTLTIAYNINANKAGNQIDGFIENTGGGTITNVLLDNSTEDSNYFIIRDDIDKTIQKSRGSFIPESRLNVLIASNWTIRTSAADNDWLNIAWSPSLGLFAAVSISGTGNRVMTSPDGINWTIRTSAADNDWQSIAWAPSLGLFAAVSNTGTGNRVMTSPDGINWTIRTSAADNSWRDVTWSPELGLFAAISNTGAGNRVMTSPDGINWTIRTSAADNSWRDVTWSPELGLFAAISNTGAGNRVMTSPDGINWTIRTSAADNSWRDVTWSPELGLFAAISNTGAGNRVMTSPDGINWTIRTSAADNSWQCVAWSPSLGLFVACSLTGGGNRIMTSPDGISWTSRISAADESWAYLAWSPDLGVFAVIAASGTGNRAMTSLYI